MNATNRMALIVVILVELRRVKRINRKEWAEWDRKVWGIETGWMWLFDMKEK